MAQNIAPIDLSIIIPTYNRAALLEHTLRSLAELRVPPGVQIETIVCDDGSSDDTFAVVKRLESQLALRYAYQPDTGHRVAAARNMGIALARGGIVLFLDCGVLAAPDLAREHLLMHACSDGGAFVIGPMWGYHSDATDDLAALATGAASWVDRARQKELPQDPRSSVWEPVGYRLDRLSAPWSIAWGTNISMPRAALLAIGGFDEAFEGWGGEDGDLAYRLYTYGLSFVVNPDAMTLHLPHGEGADAGDTNYRNKKIIFAKAPCLETELLPAFGTRLYSQRLDEIRAAARRALVPDYAIWTGQAFHAWLAREVERPIGIVGVGSGELCSLIACEWACDPDPDRIDGLRQRLPWLRTASLLGVNTGLPDATFETAILTDAWRAWQPNVVRELLKEARRVARRALLLFSPAYAVAGVPDAPAWDPERLRVTAAELGLTIAPISVDGRTAVYECSRGDGAGT